MLHGSRAKQDSCFLATARAWLNRGASTADALPYLTADLMPPVRLSAVRSLFQSTGCSYPPRPRCIGCLRQPKGELRGYTACCSSSALPGPATPCAPVRCCGLPASPPMVHGSSAACTRIDGRRAHRLQVGTRPGTGHPRGKPYTVGFPATRPQAVYAAAGLARRDQPAGGKAARAAATPRTPQQGLAGRCAG